MAEFLLGLLIGCALGAWYQRRQRSRKEPRIYSVQVDAAQGVYLHRVGKLDERQVQSLASAVQSGRPFRGYMFYDRKRGGRIMSRTQWREVTDELVGRGMAWRNPNGTVDLAPTGRAFFRSILRPLRTSK